MKQLDDDTANLVEKVIKKRRSTRTFENLPIPQGDLDKIVEAGIAAPSGSNSQNQRFLVVTDPDEIQRIGKSRFVWPYKNANQEKMRAAKPGGILQNATALVIVFSDAAITEGRNMGEYHVWESLQVQNCSAAIENMLLMSTAMGIGSCWVSASDKMNYSRMLSGQKWRSVLQEYFIPDSYRIQGIVLLGYPKSLDDEGFPKGERLHGATVWRGTERMPLAEYLIGKVESDPEQRQLSQMDSMLITFLSKILHFSLKVVRKCDRAIWKLEMIDQKSVEERYKNTK